MTTVPNIEPFEYLASRGIKTAQGIDAEFAKRLAKALLAAEMATGSKASVLDAYRSPERQAQYYANYKSLPVVWGEQTFYPQSKGGLAAPPGKSRHQKGTAADLGKGKVLDWLRENAKEFGLEFLPVSYTKGIDKGHVQMAGLPALSRTVTGQRVGEEVVAGTKQFAQGAIELAAVPWFLGGIVPAAGEAVGSAARWMMGKPPATDTPGQRALAFLGKQIQGIQSTAENVVGAGAPQGVGQVFARVFPQVVAPVKGGSTTIPSIVAGVTSAFGSSEQGTPGTLAGVEIAKKRPFDPSLLSPISTAQAGEFVVGTGSIDVPSVGGPVKVPAEELTTGSYTTLLGLTLFSIGAAVAPGAARFALRHTWPKPPMLPVQEAAPGTMGTTTRGDVVSAMYDANMPAIRAAERAGMSPAFVAELRAGLDIQTRAGAQVLADTAALIGRATATGVDFRTRTALFDIHRTMPKWGDRYAHVLDTADRLIEAERLAARNRKFRGGTTQRQGLSQVGVAAKPTVRGQTLDEVLAEINLLEQNNPALRQWYRGYKENLQELRRIESTGEWATVSRKQVRRDTVLHPNEVFEPGGAIIGEYKPLPYPALTFGDHMRVALRERFENEIKGRYIDYMRRVNPNSFRQITKDQLDHNPHWKKNTVVVKRRGKPEYYTTDPVLADTLNIDPYAFGRFGQIAYSTKRVFEKGTTGPWAPWFPPISGTRSHSIISVTAPPGSKKPWAVQSIAAIPQQFGPQLVKAFGEGFASNKWMLDWLGEPNVRALSTRMAAFYERSLIAQMQRFGGHSGTVLQQQVHKPRGRFDRYMEKANPVTRTFYKRYNDLIGDVHNAPAFAWARRNQANYSMAELTRTARGLAGNPRIGGERLLIRDLNPKSVIGQAIDTMINGTALTAEAARASVPWWNYTVQGMRAVGKAYLENPATFVRNTWTYQLLPVATAYAWNASLGPEYIEYQMNRPMWLRMMSQYVAVKGEPPENGVEIPMRFHEMSVFSAMFEVGLQQLFASRAYTPREDFENVALNWLGIVNPIVTPPPVGFGAGLIGNVRLPMGPWEGQAYTPYKPDFDNLTDSPVPQNIELAMRQLGGTIVSVLAEGLTAATHDERSIGDKLATFAKGVGTGVVKRTPYVRDITRILPDTNTQTQDDAAYRAHRAEIRALEEAFDRVIGGGMVDAAPTSKGGGEVQQDVLKDVLGPTGRVPGEPAGFKQALPNSIVYMAFMQGIHDRFIKDAPSTKSFDYFGLGRGGGGFNTLTKTVSKLREHAAATKHGRLDGTWLQRMGNSPEQKAFLESHGVNWRDPRLVHAFYVRKSQEMQRQALGYIRQTEQAMTDTIKNPAKLNEFVLRLTKLYGPGIAQAFLDELGTMDLSKGLTLETIKPYLD
jgi:hypothetical protein